MDQSRAFKKELIEFKQRYEFEAPFNWSDEVDDNEIARAYAKIDELAQKLHDFGENGEKLNDREELFNLQKTMFNEIEQCEKRLLTLKEIWDFSSYVQLNFDNWKEIPWKKIVFDDLILECSGIETYLKKHDLKYKEYKVFTNTQLKVKTMSKTLELMGELQSDDMQKRHWEELSNETMHDIKPEDPNFKFNDLYKLNLIKYTEKVQDIVEIAKNQTKIKKNLDKIKKQWDEKSFDWKELPDKETYSLEKTEDVIDLVDQDLGNLLNMLGQKKYIAYFEDLANTLTSDLRTINTLTGEFDKLQKNWNKLEPIFTQSADVKQNLAETSRKFDDMNAGFKALISEMRDQPTVKEACVVEGRVDRLKELLTVLDSCETELTA